MKRFIVAAVALMATPAFAEPAKNATSAKQTVIGTSAKERQLALQEMRGRAQLEALINQVVEEEEMIEMHGWGYERKLASNRVK